MDESETEQNWTTIPATEKENYRLFHKSSYEEDLRHAEKNSLEFPRWSIISGYYCMHDITKLFLAERFNVKIAAPNIHKKTIKALEEFINDRQLKNKILQLLKEAKDMYYSAERLKEKTLPTLLKRGKQERSKAQYYAEEYSSLEKTNPQKATYFLEKIVKPYVKIIQELMK